jgi:putative transposase
LLPTDTNATGEDTVCFLDKLVYHIGPRFTVVWDGHRIHDRAKGVRAYLARHRGIRSERFPSYAPELNPDEQVWTHTKYGRLANFAPTDIHHLRRKLHDELRRLQRRPDLLASFIHHTKLPIEIPP